MRVSRTLLVLAATVANWRSAESTSASTGPSINSAPVNDRLPRRHHRPKSKTGPISRFNPVVLGARRGIGLQQGPLSDTGVRGGGGGGIKSSSSSTAASGDGNALASLVRTFLDTVRSSRRHLAAAAVARSVSIVTMYPLDTIKTRIQMKVPNPLSTSNLFKGVTGSLIGQVPYGVLTFGSYEVYKSNLLSTSLARSGKVPPVFIYALAAVMGDLTGSAWICPSEVVKQRMQGGMYDSTRKAIRTIWRSKGIGGFYQGYLGSIARDVPFRVAQLCSYEVTKGVYLKAKQKRADQRAGGTGEKKPVTLSPIDSAVCGAVAGTFSAAVTTPLDRIKTLLMTDGSGRYGGSVASCAAEIVRSEGVKGLFAGVVPRVIYIAPSVVIFFTVYEHVQQRFDPSSTE